ncbi:MAG: hypothetical protein KDE47_12255 [Caldilineaceae bacterium]|nr:hypothetical protein [Caldilineaceae bacterium]
MPKYRLKWTPRAERAYSQLSDKLKQEVIDSLHDLQAEGVEDVAEPLFRELQGRYKYKFNGFRIILSQSADVITVLDIRRRDRNTYLNVP